LARAALAAARPGLLLVVGERGRDGVEVVEDGREEPGMGMVKSTMEEG